MPSSQGQRLAAALRRSCCVPLSVLVGTPEQNNVKGSVHPDHKKISHIPPVVYLDMLIFLVLLVQVSVGRHIQVLYLSSTTTVQNSPL